MTRRLVLATIGTSLAICAAAGCAVFGKPKVCTENHQRSFSRFLEEDWRAYCTSYDAHIQGPTEFSLAELTEFFGKHPETVENLNRDILRYEKPERCFKGPKEELEYRALTQCLDYNHQHDAQISAAWAVRVEPWLEEVRFRIAETKPKLSDVKREGDRLVRKAAEAFEFHAKMEEDAYGDYAAQVADLQKAIDRVSGLKDEYDGLRKLATGNEALATTMQTTAEPEVNALAADVDSQRKRLDEILKMRSFLEYASHSAGVACPPGVKSRSDLKLAKSMAGGRAKEVGSTDIRLSAARSSYEKGPIDFEQVTGYVCAPRSVQFDEQPKLCAKHEFVIERSKGSNVDDWDEWVLKSFSEADVKGGVDCGLLK